MQKNIIIIFLITAILFAINICFLEYYNQTKTMYFSLEQFENTDKEEVSRIVSVSENEKYFIIEGQVLTDVDNYKLDIGIENDEGQIGMHRTQFNPSMNQFYSVIPKSDVHGEKIIYIAYMCNNKNILIKTGNVIGGSNNE